ncbi:MAG TPA: hypothetical protein VHL79_00640 [Ramlibacter sp.]|nr:hypothetical protein [Ramlibacter sp.]
MQPAHPSPEACDLFAAGWRAAREECWISSERDGARMVSLDTWRDLRNRDGFVRARLTPQQADD